MAAKLLLNSPTIKCLVGWLASVFDVMAKTFEGDQMRCIPEEGGSTFWQSKEGKTFKIDGIAIADF